jgi:hypothetical protein
MEYHFRYSLSIDEFAGFNAYTMWYAPWQKKVRFNFLLRSLFYTAAIFIVSFFILNKINNSQRLIRGLSISISVVGLIILNCISYYQAPFGIMNRAKKMVVKDENSHILQETELEINQDGILTTDKDSRVHQKWNSIVRYAVTKESFYLYTNSIQAIVIPKRLFSSQKDIEEFDKFLTSKISISSSFRSL